MRVFFLRLGNCKISSDGNYLYIQQITKSDELEEVQKKVSRIVKEEMELFLEDYNGAGNYSITEYAYRRGADIHAFIRKLNDAGQ